MRRRLIALLVGALIALVGTAAAAVASGANPFGLMPGKTATQGPHLLGAKHKADQVHAAATQHQPGGRLQTPRATTIMGDDENGAQTGTSTETAASHRVTVCHHTGSWKHPVHVISVDGHALPALQAHGDTLGACPATSTPPRSAHPQHPLHSSGRWSLRGEGHGRGQDQEKHQHGDETTP